MARFQLIALFLATLVPFISASSAPVFCKCTCFKNSTIIPLGPKSQNPDSESQLLRSRFSILDSLPRADVGATAESLQARTPENIPTPRSLSTSCSECTKSFCLNQGIDFCKGAEEEDVVTMCFQRDSNKDKIIVWGFILGTTGLLGWAALKRVIERRENRLFSQQNINYTPVESERH